MNRRPRKNFRECEQTQDRGLLSMLTPAQVRQAYEMNTIEFSANGQTIPGTGAGQTIAIVGAFHNPFVTDGSPRLRCRGRRLIRLIRHWSRWTWPEHRRTLAGPRKKRDVEWSHVMAP